MEYYSAIKKNEVMPLAATWMDLETVILSRESYTEKDTHHMTSLYVKFFFKWYNELIYKTEAESQM